MSLNGLDEAAVTAAYQGALAEGGGWFLLKYASRDSVEVLARGTGGAADARGAVAQYDEKSPLYGFLLYRRRKVLIKYTPEGTSRLLQARVAVHFVAVSEKFPHETTISIASADELSDAALASACSLHTAAPSTCSSSGSSRRKLDEITEDAEEGPGNVHVPVSPRRPSTAASSKATITGPIAAMVALPPSPSPLKRALAVDLEELKPAPLHNETSEPQSLNYRDSLNAYDDLFKHGPAPRSSSQTARPAISDIYADIYAQYKPKVKLGPRPKVSLEGQRPHTSGPGAPNASRPVSSLPAGMRVANRKTPEPKRPKSRDSSVVPSIAFPPAPPVPAVPDIPLVSSVHPPRSPASVRSMTLPPSYNGSNNRNTGVTPEKQRLMKALELRKKQMKARQEKAQEEKEKEAQGKAVTAVSKFEGAVSALVEEVHALVGEVSDEDLSEIVQRDLRALREERVRTARALKEEAQAISAIRADVVPSNTEFDRTEYSAPIDIKSPSPLEDSGVDMITSLPETDDLNSAVTASSPTTALTQGSSGAPSTRPSSVSEDDNHLSEQSSKPNGCDEATLQELEKPAESPLDEDERASAQSSPTVVPESITPVPSVQGSLQHNHRPAPWTKPGAADEVLIRRNKRESMVLMPSGEQEDARSRRRSKRESMVISVPQGYFQTNETPSENNRREPATLSVAKRQSYVGAKEKPRPLVEPIEIHLGAENSEAEYLSDDSFMDELQSATVQEAKPMSFRSKSPVTPFFPRKCSISEVSMSDRSASQSRTPSRAGRLSPDQPTGRKISAPWPPITSADTMAPAKKINVSSGISQRIKALAEKSNRDSMASVSSLATPDASASIVAQRKSSFFSTPPTGNSPNASQNFMNRLSRASFAKLPNVTTPDSQSVTQLPAPSKGPTVYNVKETTEQPESVQVTARIIRDARPLKPSLVMPNETTPLDLQQSRITIDHQKSAQPSPVTKSPVKVTHFRVEPHSPKTPSSSHSNTGLPHSSSESSWRSFGRRLSESKSGSAPPRSLSAHSSESTEDKRDEKKEKKDSMTSKLFKRMSGMSAISRKSQSNLSSHEGEHVALPSVREPPPAVVLGDLNVQFPDTLLWKRRWVEIDAAGNLVLSLSKYNESRGLSKRFHLSEFRTPFAPDQDRQELPNSVILDFVDGRTLQCACETYAAQVQVLQVLRETHDAWLAYDQGL